MRLTLKLTALATVFEGRITSLVPVPIRDGDNQPVHEVRASYADVNTDELPADDNASGVAVLIELARNFAAGAPPERNLVFVAFSAEEAGLLGSRYYAEHPRPAPLEGIVGVINLDSVGRLEDQPISVLDTGSAME